MKNILTIAATGVICVLAGATQTLAQLDAGVSSTGSTTAPCTIASTDNGKLGANAEGDLSTAFTGGEKAKVIVKCGQGAKLTVGAPNVTAPAGAKPFDAASEFAGGTSTFAGATGTEIKPVATKKTGSTAFINHSVSGKDGEFLTGGKYTVTTNVTLTP